MSSDTNELKECLEAALEYIDAIPDDVASRFPFMPGFDRDWVDGVLDRVREKEKEDVPEPLDG